MLTTVTKISAIGTRGDAMGKTFEAKKDSLGRYVLNKKASSHKSGNATNKAVNKVYRTTLTEAADLLATNQYLIHLVSEEGRRALREYKKVRIDRA